MGDTDHRARVLVQVLLEPVYTLGIEVVSGLVQQQHVRLLQQQAAECHASAFTAGERLHIHIIRRAAQRIHRAVEALVDVPRIGGIKFVLQLCLTCKELVEICIRLGKSHVDLVELAEHIHDGLHTLLHTLANGFCGVELRVLLQVTDRVSRRENNLALVVLVDTCNDLHQGGFTGTVQTYYADLGAVEETEVDVIQNTFLVLLDGFAHANHREDNLFVVCHRDFWDLVIECANVRKFIDICKFFGTIVQKRE